MCEAGDSHQQRVPWAPAAPHELRQARNVLRAECPVFKSCFSQLLCSTRTGLLVRTERVVLEETSVEQFRQDTSDRPHLESAPCSKGKDTSQKQTKAN